MMKTAFASPGDDALKVIRYLVSGACLTGTVTLGDMTEYTLNTIAGDITVTMPRDNVPAVLFAIELKEGT